MSIEPPPLSPSLRTSGAKASAQSVLGVTRRPITRYRPAVIAAAAGGVVVLVGLGFMVAFGDGHHDRRAEDPPVALAQPAPVPDLGEHLPSRYDDPAALPSTAAAASPAPAPPPTGAGSDADRAVSAQQSAARQETLAARASGPFFAGVSGGRPGGEAPLSLAAPAADLPAAPPAAPAGTAKEQFIARAGGQPAYVASLPRRPLSRFEIKAGAVIPAALVTGLNSDLPGPIIAQVTQPVFDHLTGHVVLIPQGARLIGKYDSQVSHGQDRALVVWTRLIYPSGRSVDLGAMIGADPTGAGGLADRVDTHLPVLARAIGLSTLIAIGASAAQNSSARGSDNLVLQDGASGAAAAASQTGQRLVERDLQRAPTIKVRPGYPLRVIVDKDLILPPEGQPE